MTNPGAPEPPSRNDDETSWSVRQMDVVTRLRALVPTTSGTPWADRLLPDGLAAAAAQVLNVDGAAISVYLGADVATSVGGSGATASVAESLQFTLAEGPCLSS